MAKMPPRSIYAVMQQDEGWVVEHEGVVTDPCATREEAQVCALRQARAASATGVLTQVVMQGEYGYAAANRARAEPIAVEPEPN